ncbi:hypothetical protein QBC35DRAFT_200789 [Podospora australis]|uniref:N-acetyltransferase domain-containing protein n=1 Tax=Podospora australis TaxID=1536484 RepID=A0AAN7APC2_9PEZI|nr:hypothetical protein QBC35DRAFT_200789 [Podospora australis]
MAAPTTSQSQTYVFSPEQHGHLTPYIAALHASCITLDRMPGPFLPPLTNEKLLPWWKERIAECNRNARVIVLLLPETPPGKKPVGTDLRGLAMVEFSEVETGSFRGRIDALLVDRRFRRQGGAKALVAALEYESAKKGRSLLLADAETGSAAENAFHKFGYVEIGKVPHFTRVSGTPNKKGSTFFYKEIILSSASPLVINNSS